MRNNTLANHVEIGQSTQHRINDGIAIHVLLVFLLSVIMINQSPQWLKRHTSKHAINISIYIILHPCGFLILKIRNVERNRFTVFGFHDHIYTLDEENERWYLLNSMELVMNNTKPTRIISANDLAVMTTAFLEAARTIHIAMSLFDDNHVAQANLNGAMHNVLIGAEMCRTLHASKKHRLASNIDGDV